MAIDCGFFDYAGPPRTGSTWFVVAMGEVKLTKAQKATAHLPFDGQRHSKPRVMTIRHPCAWLRSYYSALHRSWLGIPCIDRFHPLPDTSFDDFVRGYLREMPGAVGETFDSYHADICLRIEDAPDNVQSLLSSFDFHRTITTSPRNVQRQLPPWSPALYDRVVAAEAAWMEKYEYTR